MNTTRRSGLNSTALALIPLAIAINIAGGQLVKTLRLPIYLDSIGTVLTGALLGPWIGLITGILSNGIWTLIGLDQFAWSFAAVAGVIGLLAGFAGRLGVFQRPSPRWLSAIIGGVFLFALTLFVMFFINATTDADGNTVLPVASDLISQNPIIFIIAILVGLAAGYFVLQNAGYAGLAGLITGVVAAVVSAPIAAYLFGGVTGSGTDALVAAFRASGANILASAFAQGTVSDPFDKMTSFMVVYLIIQSLPRRLLQRFPNAQAVQETTPVTRPATIR
jgi:energy-coupling factor transport system substrate-specific component